MSAFDQFKTRDTVNEGVKLPLTRPDGTETEHWVKVRNYRCDAYREALAALQTRIAEKGRPDAAQTRKDRLTLQASLVADWSFDEDCSPKNVKAFLDDAQLVAEAIDAIAVDDARFFGSASTLSTDGPKSS